MYGKKLYTLRQSLACVDNLKLKVLGECLVFLVFIVCMYFRKTSLSELRFIMVYNIFCFFYATSYFIFTHSYDVDIYYIIS